MKKALFTIVFAIYFFHSGYSQAVRMDSTFSEDGILTSSLTTANQRYGTAIQLQEGGEILACGHPIGSPANKLSVTRYLSDGQLDPAFDFTGHPAYQGQGTVIEVQDDGKILCGFRTGLIRLLANGATDNTFGVNGFVSHVPNFDIATLVTLPNGKIAVTGDRNDDPTLGYVVRVYHPNGTLDPSFSGDGKLTYKYGEGIGYIMKAMAQTDGKILAAGDYYKLNENKFTIFRLTPEGTFDPSFGVDGFIPDVLDDYNQVFGMNIQADGKIVVTGYMEFPKKLIVLRYMPNGTRDTTFGVGGLQVLEGAFEQEGLDVAIREDGRILILAQIGISASTNVFALVQLLADGTLDTTFGDNGIFTSSIASSWFGPRTMFLAADNKVVVGLNSTLSGNPLIIARFLLDLNVGTLNPVCGIQESALIYPNPITDHFTLNFALNAPESVNIDLFDMTGKLVKSLAQEQLFEAGEHSEPFYIEQAMPSGNYVLAVSIQGKIVSNVQIVKK